MTDSPKYRRLWLKFDALSNLALCRIDGEKYPDDIDGEPDQSWIEVINASALTDLHAELTEARAQCERLAGILLEIASWDEGDEVTSAFDCPYHANLARKALAEYSILSDG